jgi:hypothetical protein
MAVGMQEESWTKVMWYSNNKGENEGEELGTKFYFGANICTEILFM